MECLLCRLWLVLLAAVVNMQRSGNSIGWSDWLQQCTAPVTTTRVMSFKHYENHAIENTDNQTKPKSPNKLSFKLKHELEQLPDKIEALETELEELQGITNDADFYAQTYEKSAPVLDRLKQCKQELDEAVDRWAELEEMQTKAS